MGLVRDGTEASELLGVLRVDKLAGDMAIGDDADADGGSPQDVDVRWSAGINDSQSSLQLFWRCSGGGNWKILESSLERKCGGGVSPVAGGELTGVICGRCGDDAIWRKMIIV